MPELPEVETVCEAIKQNIKSRDILKFNIFNSNLRWKIDKKINNNISNNHIDKIYRRGKYIIFNFIHAFYRYKLQRSLIFRIRSLKIN